MLYNYTFIPIELLARTGTKLGIAKVHLLQFGTKLVVGLGFCY